MVCILVTGQEPSFFPHTQNKEYFYVWELSSVKSGCSLLAPLVGRVFANGLN